MTKLPPKTHLASALATLNLEYNKSSRGEKNEFSKMSQQSGSETFNILIEDLDFADQKNISKGKMLRNVLLKCQRKIVTIILIILVIAMVAIGKAPP